MNQVYLEYYINMNKKLFYRLIIVFHFLPFLASAQNNSVKQVQLTRFYLQSSEVIPATGMQLSEVSYNSKDYWFPVNVPSTVLTGLVQNKVYPDPYIGMNNMYIPDASDSFNNEYHLGKYSHIPNAPNPWKKPYWYRTTFSVPASDKGKHFQLIFKGINYRAEVWLNGKLIADSSQMVGMFAQYHLDASFAVKAGEENALAVKIFPLDYPGLPAHPQLDALGDFYDNGGPTDRRYREERNHAKFRWLGLDSCSKGSQYGHLAAGLPAHFRTSGYKQPANNY